MGEIAKRITALVMIFLAVGVFTTATDSWAAAGRQAVPQTVKLVGPDPLTVHLNDTNGAFTATFNLRIENDGPRIAATKLNGGGAYRLSVVSDRNYSKAADAPALRINRAVPLRATTITYVPVTLTVHDSDTTALTAILTVRSPPGVAPSTEDITLTRSPLAANFFGILAGSLILGALVLIVFFLSRGKPTLPPGQDETIIYTNSTFSFSQSWATSIAAILTVVATVFTTTGVLTSLVPGIDTGFFLAVTIVYGVVLSLAPLVYSALQKLENGQMYGSHIGYAIAAAITAVAVGGQLSTVGAVIWLSGLNAGLRWGLLIFLGVVALLVLWYTEQTRRQLWELPKPTEDPTTHMMPSVTPMAALP
jgi:hypothetical protein